MEVVSFGPLGASVDVVGISHDSNAMLPEGAEPYAIGYVPIFSFASRSFLKTR